MLGVPSLPSFLTLGLNFASSARCRGLNAAAGERCCWVMGILPADGAFLRSDTGAAAAELAEDSEESAAVC